MPAPIFTTVPYYPDHDTWADSFLKNQDADATLPPGFPKELGTKMAWDGRDLSLDEHTSSDGTECVLALNDSQLAEIDAALRYFQGLKLEIHALNTETFPLPSLHTVFRTASDNIHNGYGFTLVRGIPVDKYNIEENMMIYVGISSHIASVRGRQNAFFNKNATNNMITHIMDYPPSKTDKHAPPAGHTNKQITFHTEIGDIVSLYGLDGPASGGESLISSTWRIYNEMAKTRPDMIKVLTEDWPFPNGQNYNLRRPMMFHQPSKGDNPDRIAFAFSRRPFTEIRPADWPIELTEAQVEVLDTLEFLSRKFAVSMALQKGDIQFINNLSILHGRMSYEDSSTNRRHFLRQWLRDPESAWETPADLQDRWDKLYKIEGSDLPYVYALEAPLH